MVLRGDGVRARMDVRQRAVAGLVSSRVGTGRIAEESAKEVARVRYDDRVAQDAQTAEGGIVRTKIRRLGCGRGDGRLAGDGAVGPVSAAGTIQISGSGYYDDAAGTECGVPPAGFDSYAGLVLSGDLEGCCHGRPGLQVPRSVQRHLRRDGPRADRRQPERRTGGDVRDDVPVRVQVGPGRSDRRGGQGPLPALAHGGVGDRYLCGATGRLDFKDEVSTRLFSYRGTSRSADDSRSPRVRLHGSSCQGSRRVPLVGDEVRRAVGAVPVVVAVGRAEVPPATGGLGAVVSPAQAGEVLGSGLAGWSVLVVGDRCGRGRRSGRRPGIWGRCSGRRGGGRGRASSRVGRGSRRRRGGPCSGRVG